jgi:hypothetical protein
MKTIKKIIILLFCCFIAIPHVYTQGEGTLEILDECVRQLDAIEDKQQMIEYLHENPETIQFECFIINNQDNSTDSLSINIEQARSELLLKPWFIDCHKNILGEKLEHYQDNIQDLYDNIADNAINSSNYVNEFVIKSDDINIQYPFNSSLELNWPNNNLLTLQQSQNVNIFLNTFQVQLITFNENLIDIFDQYFQHIELEKAIINPLSINPDGSWKI